MPILLNVQFMIFVIFIRSYVDIFIFSGPIKNVSISLSSKNGIESLKNKNKIYKCGVCPYTTSNISSIKNHVNIHAGKKPFECNVCLRAFRLKHHLRDHMYRHTGEKPHKCFHCEEGFRTKSCRKKHMFMKHPNVLSSENYDQ